MSQQLVSLISFLLQIRAHSCGISVGTYAGRNPYNLEPTVNNLNEAAVRLSSLRWRATLFNGIHRKLKTDLIPLDNSGLQWDIRDYVLFAAREYGLRIIWVLTDN